MRAGESEGSANEWLMRALPPVLNVMLRELIKKPLLKRARTCEACGTDFQCEIGLAGCWCTEVELTDSARLQMAENYKDCLCRNCLEAAAGKKE